jgi:hypothetical protein
VSLYQALTDLPEPPTPLEFGNTTTSILPKVKDIYREYSLVPLLACVYVGEGGEESSHGPPWTLMEEAVSRVLRNALPQNQYC